jgi:hypothetical protein
MHPCIQPPFYRQQSGLRGLVTAATSGTRSIVEASAQPASISGLKLSAFRAVGGRDTQNGVCSNVTSGSKLHTAAKGETKDYARGSRRAFDSQPKGHSGSSVSRPVV